MQENRDTRIPFWQNRTGIAPDLRRDYGVLYQPPVVVLYDYASGLGGRPATYPAVRSYHTRGKYLDVALLARGAGLADTKTGSTDLEEVWGCPLIHLICCI